MVGVALVQYGFRPAVGLLHAKGGIFLSMQTDAFAPQGVKFGFNTKIGMPA
jgi:hypothetical protein